MEALLSTETLKQFDSMWRLGHMLPALEALGGPALLEIAHDWSPDGDVAAAWDRDHMGSGTMMGALALVAGQYQQLDSAAAGAVDWCAKALPWPAVRALSTACQRACTLPAQCRGGVQFALAEFQSVLEAGIVRIRPGVAERDAHFARAAIAFTHALLQPPTGGRAGKFNAWREGLVWAHHRATYHDRQGVLPKSSRKIVHITRANIKLDSIVAAIVGTL